MKRNGLSIFPCMVPHMMGMGRVMPKYYFLKAMVELVQVLAMKSICGDAEGFHARRLSSMVNGSKGVFEVQI